MSVETTSYMGFPHCLKLSNGTAELIATTDVGPRILHYGLAGRENMLALFPENSVTTTLGDWKPYGGHRLWVWPEVFPATYAPDNSPIEHTRNGELGLTLRQPTDAAGIQKEIRITLSRAGTSVTIEQRVTNRNLWPVDIAAWGITVVQCGTAIVPRAPFQSHDDCVTVAQPLALWPFTDLQDPRFTLGQPYLLLRADPRLTNSQKFGLRNKQDWCAHLVGNTLFAKRFAHEENAVYPDYGVNTQVYVEGSYMEVELLGPRRSVATNDTLTLNEEWRLFSDVGVGSEERDMDRLRVAIEPRIAELFG